MKHTLRILGLALSLILSASLAQAADAKEDLKELVGKIQTKLKAGKNKEDFLIK